jgi:hypothetical protein
MMRITKLFVLLTVTCLLFSSCAQMMGYTSENYEKILDTWVGENISSLVNQWGYPNDQFVSPSGRKVYVYEQSRIIRIPTNQITDVKVKENWDSSYTVTGKRKYNTIEYVCVTWIETNDSGDIVNWRWEGNNCVSEGLK